MSRTTSQLLRFEIKPHTTTRKAAQSATLRRLPTASNKRNPSAVFRDQLHRYWPASSADSARLPARLPCPQLWVEPQGPQKSLTPLCTEWLPSHAHSIGTSRCRIDNSRGSEQPIEMHKYKLLICDLERSSGCHGSTSTYYLIVDLQ